MTHVGEEIRPPEDNTVPVGRVVVYCLAIAAALTICPTCGNTRSLRRGRRYRRASSGGPAGDPSPSVTEPPPDADRPMISVPPDASALTRR